MPIVTAGEAKKQAVGKLDGKIRLPKDRYTLRVLSSVFGISKSSGNPMVTNEWELASPNDIEIDGQKIVIAGQKFIQYLPTNVVGDEEKSQKSRARLEAEYAKCGQPITGDYDYENPPLIKAGTLVDAICYTKEETDFKDDRKTPIKNSDGTDKKRLVYTLQEILGTSSLAVNTPFA